MSKMKYLICKIINKFKLYVGCIISSRDTLIKLVISSVSS